MCLAIPAKVISIDGPRAQVDILGNQTTADISLLADIRVGDYVMVHAGFAIQKYDKQEALENLEMIKKIVVETT
jgi:hydrogenase expression/formation protein HypC